MVEAGSIFKRSRWGWRTLIALAVVLGLPLTWHFYLGVELRSRVRALRSADTGLQEELSISVNPLTNLVSITFAMPPELDDDNPFAAIGSALGEALIQAVGPGFIERELNTRAREQYDLYAVLIPYRVRISTEPATPKAVAKMREEREKRKAEEARAKAGAEAARLEVVRAYVASGLSLEGVHVAPGKRFGKTVDGIFGTIVNNGKKTLTKVTVRFYFLDNTGRRIGEKEFSPVLVTAFSIGDNTPLRPGYRKDFGYNAKDDAPSGWSKQVEAEIVELEFSEK